MLRQTLARPNKSWYEYFCNAWRNHPWAAEELRSQIARSASRQLQQVYFQTWYAMVTLALPWRQCRQ